MTGRFVRNRRAKLLFESELVKKDMEKGREISFLEDVGGGLRQSRSIHSPREIPRVGTEKAIVIGLVKITGKNKK